MYEKKNNLDWILILTVFSLLTIGLVMVYSASSIWANYKFDDSFYFFKRQFLFANIGIIGMFFLANFDYMIWKEWSKKITIACFSLLILVLIPGIGLVRNGSRSWIGIGAFSVQPSEFIKLAVIIFLAKYLEKNQQKMLSFRHGLLPTLAFTGLAFGLIMLQPDLGTGTVLFATGIVIILASGARLKHFLWLGVTGLAGFAGLIISAPYRLERITAFLDPWKDPLGSGFQIIQSLYAIGPGGILGLGLGNSRQKFFYLPEPQTDFIYAILAEETGYIGGTIVLLLFGILLWRGIKIAIACPDLFGTFLALGIIAMISIQVMINISVVTGLIPVTGITLPLLSYGGSSLTLTLLAIGILLSISRNATI